MNISRNWLADYIDIRDLDTRKIADMLTYSGIEVEGIHERGVDSNLVVVAQVMQKIPVEGSDHLNVCMVDAGEGNLRQIICGATNYQVGDKVPCALPGAVLPGGRQIKEGKMMGHVSCGMLCAASELGLPDKENGLWLLPQDYVAGTPMQAYIPSDTIFELEITPNRPDLLNHWGMARELAGISGRTLKKDPVPGKVDTYPAGESIRICAPDACPLYTATRINGVKIGPSPERLAERLLSIGLRPINNVVDITNYCLFESGHPLHAFDAARVQMPLQIRYAHPGEIFISLMNEQYTLNEHDLVISDSSGRTLALAGIMGGLHSGVTAETTDIILESAWFAPAAIRRTSRRLGLTSDSSYRFERCASAWNVLRTAARAVQLVLESAGGQAAPTAVAGQAPCTVPEHRAADTTILSQGSDAKIYCALPQVHLDWKELDVMTAGSIPHREAARILRNLGLRETAAGLWDCPPWRMDLKRSCDLLEEIVRVYGINNIPSSRTSIYVPESPQDRAHDFRCAISHRLAGAGFREVQSFKLIAERSLNPAIACVQYALPLKPLAAGDIIRVARPLSEDHCVLRPSLSPGLLAVAARNMNQGTDVLRFFEFGRIFRNMGNGRGKDLETEVLGLLMAGRLSPAGWACVKPQTVAAHHLRAVLDGLLPKLTVTLSPANQPRPSAALGADIRINGQVCGYFARVAPSVCRALDLATDCYYAELDVRRVQQLATAPFKVRDLPLYPASRRDAALVLPTARQHVDVIKVIEEAHLKFLVACHLKEVFTDPTGEKLPPDRKVMTYGFTYRDPNKTLTAVEVDAAHAATLQLLTRQLPDVSIR